MSGFLSACDHLAPIDEAQIVIDEQRTKMLSNGIKTDQETFHEFPINYIINQQISDTLIIDTPVIEPENYQKTKFKDICFTNDLEEFDDLTPKSVESEKKSLIFEPLFKQKSTESVVY